MFNSSNKYLGESLGSGDLGYDGFPISLNYFTSLPDPSVLHNPNLTIMFKSLLKKDSITKEKSLNDLANLFNEPEYQPYLFDDLLIMSWIQLYPKLAIDNSRSVRVLSHQIQAKFLQTVGGKNYSKYLKSSIPVWLHGLFDNDKIVANSSYKSLLESFQNDKDKIDSKIWIIFYKPIVNYIITSVTLESHESLSDQRYTKESDSFAKYERVLNGSLLMLIKIITLINNNQLKIKKEDEELQKIEALLNSQALWDYLGSSVVADTLNLPLFKTLLILLKTIFLKTENEPNVFVRHLADLKSLYKLVSKKFIKNVKFKSNSKSSVVYSNVILQFWDTLTVLTNFSNLLPSDKRSFRIKKNFWEIGGSKCYSRLIEYLKLGHCLSDPIYYTLIGQFFDTLSKVSTRVDENEEEVEFLSFEEIEDAESIIVKILVKQFKSLPNLDYKEKALKCILKVYQTFSQNITEFSSILKITCYSIIDSLSKRMINDNDRAKKSAIISQYSNYLKEILSVDSIAELFEDLNSEIINLALSERQGEISAGGIKFESSLTELIDTYIQILSQLKDDELSTSLINRVIEGIEEDTTISKPTIVFHIISLCLKYNLSTETNISSFLEIAPTFMELDFVELPINLLSNFLKSNLRDEVNIKEIINSYYLKLSLIDKSQVPKLLSIVDESFNIEEESFSDIFNYIIELSEKRELIDDEYEIVYKYANVPLIFNNLIKNSSDNDIKGLKFIKYSLKNSINIANFVDNENIKCLLFTAWKNINDSSSQKFIDELKSSKDLISGSVFEFISKSSLETNFSAIVKYLNGDYLPVDKIIEKVIGAVNHVNNNLLSIANPLEQNIHLANTKGEPYLDSSLIIFGSFLLSCLDSINSLNENIEILILSGIIGEYIHDYIFLTTKHDVENSNEILSIREGLLRSFLSKFQNTDLFTLLPIINANAELDANLATKIFSHLNKSVLGHSNYEFYSARLLRLALEVLIEKETVQSFEKIPIEFNRLISSPLKLAVILLTTSKFFTQSTTFDRIRNYVTSEILGVEESQILKEGLKWLSLSINFFNTDQSYEVIPPHRLVMVLNKFSKWLESDISFDESFIVIRSQLAKILCGMLANFKSLPAKFWELATQLTIDNLGMVQVETKHLELRYFTLKLFIALSKSMKEPPAEEFEENKSSLYEEILEILVNEEIQSQDIQLNNHPVSLNHDLIRRIFNGYKFPRNILNENIDRLYLLLSHCKFTLLQRIGASLLHETILVNQQDFVVEYQLQKSNLGSQDDESQYQAKLPEALLNSINMKVVDIESDSPYKVAQFLWSWYLIFDYFKEITYSMRAEYINQLKDNESINKLLNFIFEQVDISDNNILKKLTISDDINKVKVSENLIQDYKIKEGYPSESFIFEMKFLLIHLYYLSFQYFGSYVQSWFNSIRDRQLKQQIEKFSIKYVSPLIVSKILEDVSNSKDKLNEKDDNMTIKVNSVANEIKSVYIIDDQTMEMIIKIPASYPLSNVIVEGPLRVGVKENQWKAWLLASQRIISLTNGSIMEAIELFNRNVNLHFSGFEDCSICYSILHQDHSLPSKTCPTCSNKFHAACLYKWFKSSGGSTCPLCRSAFNFRSSRTVTS